MGGISDLNTQYVKVKIHMWRQIYRGRCNRRKILPPVCRYRTVFTDFLVIYDRNRIFTPPSPHLRRGSVTRWIDAVGRHVSGYGGRPNREREYTRINRNSSHTKKHNTPGRIESRLAVIDLYLYSSFKWSSALKHTRCFDGADIGTSKRKKDQYIICCF